MTDEGSQPLAGDGHDPEYTIESRQAGAQIR
jgi:hypothetical protein